MWRSTSSNTIERPGRSASGPRRLRARNILFALSAGFILLLFIVAAAAPVVAPFEPTGQDYTTTLARPGTRGHPLGTDDLGRDVISRVIYGGRSTLTVGSLTVSIALVTGLVLGLLAGLGGRWLDETLMLLMDGVLSFPAVLVAIAVVSVFGYGLTQVMVAMGFVFSPLFARIVRAETLRLKHEGYVESARALGSSLPRIVARHIVPNMVGRVIVQCSATFALSIVVEAGLSYLGLGTQPPNPSWGLMLKDARSYVFNAPWLALYPGLAIALTVLMFNILGDTLSDLLNPHSARD
jgi:peptide/nickel transport system permease protein